MKAKSMKMRFLITLYALFRHSDEDHRLNTSKINEFLRPYQLDCTGRVLNDTVSVRLLERPPNHTDNDSPEISSG